MGSYSNTGVCLDATQYSLFGVPQSLQLTLHLLYHHGEWSFSVCCQTFCSQLWYCGTQSFRVLLCQNRGDAKDPTGLWGEDSGKIKKKQQKKLAFRNDRGYISVRQRSLLGAIGLRCWQCWWTERWWVWTSPACHRGKALNPWWRVYRRLPLQRQGDSQPNKCVHVLYIYICIQLRTGPSVLESSRQHFDSCALKKQQLYARIALAVSATGWGKIFDAAENEEGNLLFALELSRLWGRGVDDRLDKVSWKFNLQGLNITLSHVTSAV